MAVISNSSLVEDGFASLEFHVIDFNQLRSTVPRCAYIIFEDVTTVKRFIE
jgi:hypothetical protein